MNLGQPTDRKPPFKYSALTRVGFSDTDAQGIVYYGRYLPYFDDARVEYLRHLGLLDADLAACEFVMRACNVLYEAPAAVRRPARGLRADEADRPLQRDGRIRGLPRG